MLNKIAILINLICIFIWSISLHACNDDENRFMQSPSHMMVDVPIAITVSPENIQPKQARPITYGALDALPRELIGRHIFIYCDNKILQVNTSFFTLGTGYPSDHILDQGFDSRLSQQHYLVKTNRKETFNVRMSYAVV